MMAFGGSKVNPQPERWQTIRRGKLRYNRRPDCPPQSNGPFVLKNLSSLLNRPTPERSAVTSIR